MHGGVGLFKMGDRVKYRWVWCAFNSMWLFKNCGITPVNVTQLYL